MANQEFPQRVYKGRPDKLESKLVNNEAELKAANEDGFGEHPALRIQWPPKGGRRPKGDPAAPEADPQQPDPAQAK